MTAPVHATGTYRRADGWPSVGTVSFTLLDDLQDPGTFVERDTVTATLDADGALRATLLVYDTQALFTSSTDQTQHYAVVQRIDGVVSRYVLDVPWSYAGHDLPLPVARASARDGVPMPAPSAS